MMYSQEMVCTWHRNYGLKYGNYHCLPERKRTIKDEQKQEITESRNNRARKLVKNEGNGI